MVSTRVETLVKLQVSPTPPVEVAILEIGKFTILTNQLTGYLPLKIVKTPYRSFHLNLCSLPFISAISIMVTQLIGSYSWTSSKKYVYQRLYVHGETNIAAFSSTGIGISIGIYGQRIAALLCAKNTLKFWKQLCQGLEGISNSDPYGSFKIHWKLTKHAEIFSQIRSNIRKRFFIFLLPSIPYLIFFGALGVLQNWEYVHSINDTTSVFEYLCRQVLTTLMSSWNIICSLHFLFSGWISFPIQMCTGCLKMISEELVEMFSKYETALDAKRMNANNKTLQFPRTETHFLIVDRFVSEKYKNVEVNEQKLAICIENYYRVYDLMKVYDGYMSKRLIVEIGTMSLMIVGYGFISFSWYASKQFGALASRLALIMLALQVLYNFGTDSSRLSEEARVIQHYMCRLPHHLLSDQMILKVKFLVAHVSNNPLAVEPGGYFTVNRRIITSILSAILTYLIVLVQFSGSEKSHSE